MIRRASIALFAFSLVLSLTVVGSASSAQSRVLVPRTSNSHTYGLDSYVSYDCQSPTVWSTDATHQIDAFKALGANSIGLSFPLYTNSITSNEIFAATRCGTNYKSPTPSQLATVVGIANASGLSVLIRPLLDERSLKQESPGYWRGEIRPTSVARWFANYLNTLTPYLEMAQSSHASGFALSTELSSMNRLSNWKGFIASAAHIFTGTLVMTDSWAPSGRRTLWPGTSSGIDAYRPLPGAQLTWTPAQLLAGWDAVMKTTPIPDVRNTTITEIGIPAQVGAYFGPSGGPYPLSGHPMNQSIQLNWFTMACSFMRGNDLRGMYFWGATMTNLNGELPTTIDSASPYDIQPESQVAIANCFGVGADPSIQSLSVKHGTENSNTRVVITGTNFTGTFDVTFGTVPATSVDYVSSTELIATTPKMPKSSVNVQVVTEAGSSATSSSTIFSFT
jgi:hypothetical protein